MAKSTISPRSFKTKKKSFLPPVDSKRYYLLIGLVAAFILGPLGGITAAYMNFSLGFFVGGQVLAGILGSAVTYGYGAEGKHGANYMQTMAASVASMSGMAVLIQAMVWLGLPIPHWTLLVLFFTCIGMFGVGVGMLYTSALVDRMQLMYPSGFAVANILRALTDIRLLKQSIAKLSGGTALGIAIPMAALRLPIIDEFGLSSSTVGAGMIVGARIGIAGLVVGGAGYLLTPYLVSTGWLHEGEPFRKIGFVAALGMILGAAIVDMTLIGVKVVARLRDQASEALAPADDWKQTNIRRLWAWIAFWGISLFLVSTNVMHVPALYVLVAIALVFVFVMANGISCGISDSNPISSAFVITVFILSAFGLKDAGTGLLAAGILLISTSTGVDMQQDRSTGARLGTNRIIQFRFQVIGILVGAVMAVLLAKVFMSAYPDLRIDQYTLGPLKRSQWGSAMTYKFVGALQGLTHPNGLFGKALEFGITLGLITEVLRKLLKANAKYIRFIASGKFGFTVDFLIDAVILPSPYASSFGGFVELPVTLWFALGGVITSVSQTFSERLKSEKKKSPIKNITAEGEGGELPEDMSATSLIGGGLIAGDSLAALGIGIAGLLKTIF
jgi:uncharacterized oligopeptide transporter (OPT) family protein